MSIGALAKRTVLRIDRRWLALFVAIDVAFVVLHLAQRTLGDKRFSMLEDGGYAEDFRYLQSALIAMLATVIAKRRRDPFCAAAAVLFGYVLLDDVLRIHESAGIWLTDHVAFFTAAGGMGHALGELAYLSLPGSLALAALLVFSRSGEAIHCEIVALVGGLGLSGIGLDFLHSLGGVLGWPGLSLLEGIGELLAFSLAAAYFIALSRADQMRAK